METKNESEKLFEQYLDLNGFSGKWTYEPQIQGKSKKPDYLLDYNGQKCLFEVKELREKPNKSTASPFFNAYSSLRSEIDEAREKFKEFKEYSCSLVVYKIDDVRAILEPPHFVFGAMLGDCGVEWEPDSNKTNNSFLDNGKMIDKKRKQPQNTTINAIIVLKKFRDDTEINRKVIEKHSSNYVPGVCMIENPFARVAFPESLFAGPFDEHWRHTTQNGAIERFFVGNRLRELEELKSKP